MLLQTPVIPFTAEQIRIFEKSAKMAAELTSLRAFVRDVSQQKTDCAGQRQSNKERAEDLCEQWGIT